MAREKLQTLTEQMFYVLLALTRQRCGTEISQEVKRLSNDRISISSGTLYGILSRFVAAGMICEESRDGRKITYKITPNGVFLLKLEFNRLITLCTDAKETMLTL